MRVAMMVRGFLETPVPNDIAYSPALIAKDVAEGLYKKGHEVTFFGPSDTKLDVTEVKTAGLQGLVRSQAELDDLLSEVDMFERYRLGLYDQYMAKQILEEASQGKYDCVIFNHFESVLPLASLFPKVPIVYILHDFIDDHRREMIERYATDNQYCISISDSQRRNAPDLNYAATIYNGIDTELFTTDGEPEPYLMVAGRIAPIKGIKEAVQIALQTDRRLLITGSLSKEHHWYFDEHIKPFLNNQILFLGMLERAQLVKYYQKAAGILVPIQWQEPFGLTMIEAGACGTPTIAFNRGSVPEVVKEGKTGFIVNNSAEMIMAIEKLDRIKRDDCRSHVVNNFSVGHMVDSYEKILQSIISGHAGVKHDSPSPMSNIRGRIKKISRHLLDT